MDLISVIVPVYKVEKYLDKCVASIVNQTYKNLEIILVDDGSPDNCGAMCDAWAAKDSRIRVIHKENGGLSDARNAGMAVAAGEWIAFVDSDDWIADDMYEALLRAAREHNCGVTACQYALIYSDKALPEVAGGGEVTVLDRLEAMHALIQDGCVRQVVWNKLYRADLVRDIPFAVGKCHEDEFWTWQVIARIDRYAMVDCVGYYYLQRGGSIMGQSYSTKRLDVLEAKEQRLDFLKGYFPALVECAETDLLFSCLYHGQLVLKHLQGKQKRQALERLRKTFCSIPIGTRTLTVTHKFWLNLAMCNFELCCKVRSILGVGE